MARVKVCPSCGSLPLIAEKKCHNQNCGYNFTGDEDGVKEKSVILDTLQEPPSIAGLEQHLLRPPSARRVGDEIKCHAKRILLGVSLLGGGILCYLASWIFIDIKFAAGMFQLVGILGVLFGLGLSVVLLLKGTKDILIGPNQKNTADAITSYYQELLFQWPQNLGLSWSVLSPIAQSEFGTFGEFKDYWVKTIKDIQANMESVLKSTGIIEKCAYPKGWSTKYDFNIENIKTTNTDNNEICVLNYDLVLIQEKTTSKPGGGPGTMIELFDGQVTIRQTTALVRLCNNWYLCNGRLTLPPNW